MAAIAHDVVDAFCIDEKCRTERRWTRALPTSLVYACTSCGRTREFSVDRPGSVSGAGAPTKRTYTNRRKEIPVKKSPLIEAIEKIVNEKLAAAKTGLDRAAVVAITDERIQEMLGVPARSEATPKSGCPRGVHKGIHGRKCREAGYVA